MSKWIINFIAQYLAVGCVFACFVALLAKHPTARLILFEFFCWPRRVYRGLRLVLKDAGKVDFDKPSS